MWCSMFSFSTLNFAPHCSLLVATSCSSFDDHVRDVVLLEAFEDDVAGLGVPLERGVEELLFDQLVDAECLGDCLQQLGAGT